MTASSRSFKSRVWRIAQPGLAAIGSVGASRRALPDFLIIGAQRCGTTSLHEWLSSNPGIRFPRLGKGVHYFDTAADRDLWWYRSHFPMSKKLARDADRAGIAQIRVGEASPYYLFHPAVPERAKVVLPGIQAIVVLRDPVSRAWSHYLHEQRRGFEDLSFVDAIRAEPDRLGSVDQADLNRRDFVSFEHQHHSYVARGHYTTQLQRWFDAVGRDQVCVIFDTDLYAPDGNARRRVAKFLGLNANCDSDFPRANATKAESMPDAARRLLEEALAGEGARISELLGIDPGWSV